MAALMSDSKGKRPKLSDFLLKWSTPRRRPQTAEGQLNLFRALALRQESRGNHR